MERTENQYDRIAPLLPRQRGNIGMSNPQVLNVILHVAEYGCKWRGLPPCFGNSHTVCARMNRWPKMGVLDRVFEQLQSNESMGHPSSPSRWRCARAGGLPCTGAALGRFGNQLVWQELLNCAKRTLNSGVKWVFLGWPQQIDVCRRGKFDFIAFSSRVNLVTIAIGYN